MPATSLTLSAGLSWVLQAAAGAFCTPRSGNVSLQYGANSGAGTLGLATWTQVDSLQFWLPTGPPTGLAAALAAGGSLNVATTYYYKVTGIGPSGQNGAGSVETAGSLEVSVTPTTGQQSAALSWTPLQGATAYNLYRGTTAGSENVLVATVVPTAGATTVGFTDANVSVVAQSPPAANPPLYVEFSLATFTNSIAEAASAGHAWALFVVPTGAGSTCVVSPGASNGLAWMLGGTSPTYTVNPGGMWMHAEAPSGPGQVLSSGQQNLRVANGGSAPLTASIVAVVGP